MKSLFALNLFQGKTLLVTGGGTGLGYDIAESFYHLGGSVFIVGRREEVLKEAAEKIGKKSKAADSRILYQSCDIREEEQITKIMGAIKETWGRLDYLVNNAGGQFPSPAEKIPLKGFRAVIETNLIGTFMMSQAVFNAFFSAQKKGAIVNILADVHCGFPLMAHTGAARAGVYNLTMSLATEWGNRGVRVNAVSPGVIASSGLATYPESFQHMVEKAKTFNQTSRLGKVAEVSHAVLFLLSPAATFITGVNLPVDGGQALYSPYLPPQKNACYPETYDD